MGMARGCAVPGDTEWLGGVLSDEGGGGLHRVQAARRQLNVWGGRSTPRASHPRLAGAAPLAGQRTRFVHYFSGVPASFPLANMLVLEGEGRIVDALARCAPPQRA